MKILVTGGAGFIGSAVVRAAISAGHSVVNLDCLTYAGCLANVASVADDPRYAFEHGDIGDRVALKRIFGQYMPDAVIHLAAESHVDRSITGPSAFVSTNALGTACLLGAACDYWNGRGRPDDFRFLHVSTDEVYGSLDAEGQFTEDSPYAPRSPYAASKAAADHLVRAWHETYGIPTLITNCSNNYGPFQHPEKLVPVVILNAIAGREIPIYGKGTNVRDWLHVEDHVRALFAVLFRGQPGRSYNIGASGEMQNIDFVETICRALDELAPTGRRHAEQIAFVTDRPGHDMRYAIDAGRIRAELGWRPSIPLADGLRRTIAWYLDHADRCCVACQRAVEGKWSGSSSVQMGRAGAKRNASRQARRTSGRSGQ